MKEPKKCGVYQIRSISKPERIYIGSSNWMQRRWIDHKYLLKLGQHHSPALQYHYNKYGVDDLEHVWLEQFDYVSKAHQWEREQFYINKFIYRNTSKPYFNASDKARGPSGVVTDETRAKLSAMRMGHSVSDLTKAKLSVSHTGKKMSDAACKKMSDYWLSFWPTDEGKLLRLRISESSKGNVPPNKGRKKICDIITRRVHYVDTALTPFIYPPIK